MLGLFFAAAALAIVSGSFAPRVFRSSEHQVGELTGDHVVFALQNIQHRLGAEDFTRRDGQCRIAAIAADVWISAAT